MTELEQAAAALNVARQLEDAAEKAFMAAKAALEHERDCRREAESQLYRAVEVFTQQRAKQ